MNDAILLAPLWVLVLAGLLVLVMDRLLSDSGRGFLGHMAIMAMLVSAGLVVGLWDDSGALVSPWLQGVVHLDAFVRLFALLILGAGVASVACSTAGGANSEAHDGGYQALILFAVTGALVFVAASDLITLFLGLEVMSLAVYVLAASRVRSPRSVEAGLKYFVTGGVAGAFLLLGTAFLYGATGSLDVAEIGRYWLEHDVVSAPLMAQVGMLLWIVALGFKVSAVPFHMWTPDVYEGAPVPITLFMAGAIKAAGFAVLARLLLTAFQAPGFMTLEPDLPTLLLVLALGTMTLGNLLGVLQTSVVRLLAYSSIAHAGHLLLGMVVMPALTDAPASSALHPSVPFHLVTYVVASIGAFGVLAFVARARRDPLTLEHLDGLGRRHPLLALVLAGSVLSLAGVPPTAGFLGKLYVFQALLAADRANLPWVIVAVLNAVVALYYYLRILVHVYFREPPPDAESGGSETDGADPLSRPSLAARVVIGASLLTTLVLGILPQALVTASSEAAAQAPLVIAGPAEVGSAATKP